MQFLRYNGIVALWWIADVEDVSASARVLHQ